MTKTPDPHSEATAAFGFSEVPRAEKSARVRAVFDSVARRYDLMNDLMSAGLHRAWKDALAARANPQPGETILDLAGGTGDIARRLARLGRAAARRRGGDPPTILVCDINVEMLKAGRTRGAHADLVWLAADAERLPIRTASADAVTIAFGIRNVTTIANALSEARRALKPGGRFLCLEFSRPAVIGLDPLYDAYSFGVIPAIGALVAQDRAAYRYLVESIRRFPDQQSFARMIAAAGFSRVGFTNFTGGVAALHTAWAL